MSDLHSGLGGLAIGLNVAAALIGFVAWLLSRNPRPFWWILRSGQVLIMLEAVTGAALLLLVCFANEARTLPLIADTKRFGVNVLSAGQEDLARLFASKLPEAEKFAGVQHSVQDGIPVIDGVLAWVGCTLQELIPGGDHTIGIGRVTAAEEGEGGKPLVWYRGEYR